MKESLKLFRFASRKKNKFNKKQISWCECKTVCEKFSVGNEYQRRFYVLFKTHLRNVISWNWFFRFISTETNKALNLRYIHAAVELNFVDFSPTYKSNCNIKCNSFCRPCSIPFRNQKFMLESLTANITFEIYQIITYKSLLWPKIIYFK